MKKLIFLGLLLVIIGVFWFFTSDGQDWTAPSIVHAENPSGQQVEDDVASDVQLFTARDGATIERFFYEQLTDDEQAIYRILRNGLATSATEIQIDGNDFDTVRELFQRVLWDYPEFFWATGSMEARLITRSDGQTHLILMPEYAHLGATQESMQYMIDEAVDNFLATITDEMTDFDKVLAVYEYIISTITYSWDGPDHQNIASVFIHRESVCAGISKAAQLLMNRLGIFATYIVGDAFIYGSDEPFAHAWNLVRLNGEYYHLDLTWGLPNFGEESTIASRISILYDYFLVNDALIAPTHVVADGIVLPTATSLQSNYFVVNDMFYEAVDQTTLLSAMQTSIANDEDEITFKFASNTLFNAAITLLVDNGLALNAATPRANELGLSRTQISFRPKPNLNLITIYWVWE